jgi:hypothetical protein
MEATLLLAPSKGNYINHLIPESYTGAGKIITKNYDVALGELFSTSEFQNRIYVDKLSKRFRMLKDAWLQEIKLYSNPEKITSNKYYELIIELGVDVIPLIISDLQQHFNFWFPALERITGINPVAPDNKGNIRSMAEDWLNWYNKVVDINF